MTRRSGGGSCVAGYAQFRGSERPILTQAVPGLNVNTLNVYQVSGRIISLRMRPMVPHERGIVEPTISLASILNATAGRILGSSSLTAGQYYQAIVSSGLSDIFPLPAKQSARRLETYIQRVIDRDLTEQGYVVRRPETLRRWMGAYAAASFSTASYSTILDATTAGDGGQPARTTTIAYRDHLTQLWLLDPVPAWEPRLNNPFKWLQYTSKHQLADPGLAARLLGLNADALGSARGAAMAGPLFESLVTLSVRVAAEAADARVGHLRTKNGDHEVDLIVESFDGDVLGIEVKLSASVTDSHVKHLIWLKEQLGDRVVDLAVIYSGTQAYRRHDGIAVIPLALLGP